MIRLIVISTDLDELFELKNLWDKMDSDEKAVEEFCSRLNAQQTEVEFQQADWVH